MITSLLRVVAALFALTFIVAACASESGAEWTFDPTVVAGADASESSAEPAASAAPAAPAAPVEPAAAATETPAESAVPEPEATSAPASAAGEARVIELQADGALRFTDASGEQVRDIAVTPGETVTFRIDNTAGFPHNFYIGEDSELMTPAGSTDTGIPDWATGVQELEWVVPDDIADLKFGCTVPGHYALMQGTFSLGAPAAPAEPAAAAATETPAESAVPEPEATSAPASAAGEARVIELQADGALRFTDASGEQVRDIAVTPGETVTFRIDNTAGFPHNFYIGEDSELMTPAGSTDTGIPDWATGVQELEWVVPDDIADLKFGCTVPGHYALMQGTFSLGAPAAPAEPAAAATETPAESAVPEPEATSAPASAAGEARVIELQADGALRFTDASGEQVRDIAVTPGETVTFRIDNTAGFPHNFYIGEDSELMTPAGSTDTGIPDWATGVQELEWVVPDDIADLKFGCTVPGHYALMQGTFSLGAPAAPAEPAAAATETPAESAAPEPEATSAPASAAGEARVIELQADGALRFTDASGEQVRDIAVTPGETVTFRIDNTAGFPHNFYIGEDSELMTPAGSTDTGIPDWATGVQELEWVVPDDIADLKFGCTVPGHYALMQGTFSVSP